MQQHQMEEASRSAGAQTLYLPQRRKEGLLHTVHQSVGLIATRHADSHSPGWLPKGAGPLHGGPEVRSRRSVSVGSSSMQGGLWQEMGLPSNVGASLRQLEGPCGTHEAGLDGPPST